MTLSLVTGANRGIGAALYAQLSANGKTVGTARTPSHGSELATLDVTKPDSVAALAASLNGAPLDLLVCNAGVYLDKGADLETGYAPQLWADSFATNVTGVFLTIQALLPNLRAAPAARIAIISSQMGSSQRAPGGSYIYRASKSAVLNLGRNMASDFRPMGISVGIYHPGWVQTDMGGMAAQITVDQAADGLMARFANLSIDTTGVFETYDGTPHPF
ncbi:MAG: NAD(P)-dependent dehydrogenase (short-subunit alcohol dehydrogenase family) [Paracoccaceae bacterium]|jgi:NAD(P)-dependent dehydrogenase (short-subunit alcohol dehydrogenase family)